MNTGLMTVDLKHASTEGAELMRRQLASVPELFREGDSGADVIVVDGDSSSWPMLLEAALVRSSTRGVMVTKLGDCARKDLDRAVDMVGRRGLPVVVASPMAGTAAWRAAVPDVREARDLMRIIECVSRVPVSVGRQWAVETLAEQLILLASIWGSAPTLDSCHVSSERYVVAGTLEGVSFGLAGTTAEEAAASMQGEMIGLDNRWILHVPSALTARPATVERHTSGGVTVGRPVFESAGRSAWIYLHDRLSGAAPAQPEFTSVAEHLHTALVLLGNADTAVDPEVSLS